MMEFALAGAAGVATIASPCILPVLPIVLATTAGRGRLEPLLIIAGFVGSFAAGGVLLGALSGSSAELQQGIRTGSILLLLASGLACIWSGPFERVVGVGTEVDEGRISARLENGVLTITLPKKPEWRPRRIEVQ